MQNTKTSSDGAEDSVALSRQKLLTFAKRRAVARLRDLEAEIAMIRRAFPTLGADHDGAGAPGGVSWRRGPC